MNDIHKDKPFHPQKPWCLSLINTHTHKEEKSKKKLRAILISSKDWLLKALYIGTKKADAMLDL